MHQIVIIESTFCFKKTHMKSQQLGLCSLYIEQVVVWMAKQAFYSWQIQDTCLFVRSSKPALVPTQCTIQWLQGVLCPVIPTSCGAYPGYCSLAAGASLPDQPDWLWCLPSLLLNGCEVLCQITLTGSGADSAYC